MLLLLSFSFAFSPIAVYIAFEDFIVTALSSFVDLPLEEKRARGLLFTPAEIAQQPVTWKTTLRIFEEHQTQITAFLEAAGVRDFEVIVPARGGMKNGSP